MTGKAGPDIPNVAPGQRITAEGANTVRRTVRSLSKSGGGLAYHGQGGLQQRPSPSRPANSDLRAFRITSSEEDESGRFVYTAKIQKRSKAGPGYGEWQDHPDDTADYTLYNTSENAGSVSSAIDNDEIVWARRIQAEDEEGDAIDEWWIVGSSAPPDAAIAVLVTVDGGSSGSASATCSFTYTVKSLSGDELGAKLTPKRPRFTNTTYEQPSADSPGLAFYDNNGDFQLYEAVEEVPATKLVTHISDWRVDPNNPAIQVKTQDIRVLEAGTESDWTTVHSGNSCCNT